MWPRSSWQGIHVAFDVLFTGVRGWFFLGGVVEAEVALSRGLELINPQLLLTPLINREALHNSLPPFGAVFFVSDN